MTALISRAELHEEITAGTATVVETLGPSYYESGHLPGAINIPHTQVRELAPTLLPDKDAAIVTYCSNTACGNSEAVAGELTALGYSNVRKYAEGKQDWTEAGLPVSRRAGWPAPPRADVRVAGGPSRRPAGDDRRPTLHPGAAASRAAPFGAARNYHHATIVTSYQIFTQPRLDPSYRDGELIRSDSSPAERLDDNLTLCAASDGTVIQPAGRRSAGGLAKGDRCRSASSAISG